MRKNFVFFRITKKWKINSLQNNDLSLFIGNITAANYVTSDIQELSSLFVNLLKVGCKPLNEKNWNNKIQNFAYVAVTVLSFDSATKRSLADKPLTDSSAVELVRAFF